MTMTTTRAARRVVPFRQREQAASSIWRQDEMQTLVAFHAAAAAAGDAHSWEVSVTDAGDPQFYLLGPGPEHDCVLCVSKVRRVYVVEDDCGTLVAENVTLSGALDEVTRQAGRGSKMIFLRALWGLCAFRIMIEQKLEPFTAEMTENITRFAPFIGALV